MYAEFKFLLNSFSWLISSSYTYTNILNDKIEKSGITKERSKRQN
jgi:hypothetical protein